MKTVLVEKDSTLHFHSWNAWRCWRERWAFVWANEGSCVFTRHFKVFEGFKPAGCLGICFITPLRHPYPKGIVFDDSVKRLSLVLHGLTTDRLHPADDTNHSLTNNYQHSLEWMNQSGRQPATVLRDWNSESSKEKGKRMQVLWRKTYHWIDWYYSTKVKFFVKSVTRMKRVQDDDSIWIM